MKVHGLSSSLPKVDVPEAKIEKLKDDRFQRELEKAFNAQDEEKLRVACKGFETVFMNIMYKQMKATVPEGDIVPDSFAKQTFENMLDEELITETSQGQGMGLGEMLFKQLSHQMKNAYQVSEVSEVKKSNTGEDKE
ncbi:MAG: rod-binding protein [Clostridia bacterium]